MRSVPKVVLSLISVVLLLSVCTRGGSSTQSSSALSYASSTAIYTKGVLVTANIPSSNGSAHSVSGLAAGNGAPRFPVSEAVSRGYLRHGDITTPMSAVVVTSYRVPCRNAARTANIVVTISRHRAAIAT